METAAPPASTKVLLVEDHPSWQSVHQLLGAKLGLTIDAQSNVSTAYWRFAAAPADYLAAIVDLDLKNTTQLDGIDLVLSLAQRNGRAKTRIPILCRTSAGDEPRVSSLFGLMDENGVVGILDKLNSGTPEVLGELLRGNTQYFRDKTDTFQRAHLTSRPSVPLRIKWDAGATYVKSWAEAHRVAVAEVEVMVAALCEKALLGYSEVRAAVLPPGYSGCLPVRLFADDRGTRTAKNYLLKVGPPGEAGREQLGAEARNYDQFAAAIMRSAPLLLGLFECNGGLNGRDLTWFALAYELIGSAEIHVADFSGHVLDSVVNAEHHSKRHVVADCHARADSLLKPLRGWYAELRTMGTDPTLRLIRDVERILDKAETTADRFFDDRSATGVIGLPKDPRAELPDPIRIARHLVAHGWPVPALTAGVIHGDLNCRNIVRRVFNPTDHESSRWALVDFEDVTAKQHVLLDMATLECDLKLHQRARFVEDRRIDLADLRRLARLEVEIAINNEVWQNQAPELKAMRRLTKGALPWGYTVLLEQILILRSAARREFWPDLDDQALWSEWSTALLCTSLRYLTYASDDITRRYAWFAAAVAASTVERTLTRV